MVHTLVAKPGKQPCATWLVHAHSRARCPYVHCKVFCDRHYGGINYPLGGVGLIAENLADGIEEHGGTIVYKANVKEIVMEGTAEVCSDCPSVLDSLSPPPGPLYVEPIILLRPGCGWCV